MIEYSALRSSGSRSALSVQLVATQRAQPSAQPLSGRIRWARRYARRHVYHARQHVVIQQIRSMDSAVPRIRLQ